MDVFVFPELDKENLRPKTKLPNCPRCSNDELSMFAEDRIICNVCTFEAVKLKNGMTLRLDLIFNPIAKTKSHAIGVM